MQGEQVATIPPAHTTNITNEQLADYMPTYESVSEKDFEWMQSDEYIIESIEANEYEFTQDGKMY